MSYHSSCLICDSTRIIDLKEYDENFLGKCEECSFVFSKKIPSYMRKENLFL